MGEIQAYFIGFREFVSKKGVQYHVLNFLLVPKPNKEYTSCFPETADVFVEAPTYSNIVQTKKLMELVNLKYEVNGTRVFYSL